MTRTRFSKKASAGVVAGVLAGSAIGLVATVPNLTSAASNDPGLQEVPDDATDDATADDVGERGDRLRSTLQPLVDDGTINESQADAVAAHLVTERAEHRGDRQERRGDRRERRAEGGAAVAEALGIDQDALRSELRAGSSLAEIAEANGVDTQVLIDALVAQAEARLADSDLDATEAAEKLAEMTEKIEERING